MIPFRSLLGLRPARSLCLTESSLVALALILAAPPAAKPAASDLGKAYESQDFTAKAPGSRWKLQTVVPNAPNLRGAYVYARSAGTKDRSSLITFAIEQAPVPDDPEKYEQTVMELLKEPPMSMKLVKGSAFTLGKMPGYRMEYTDKDGIRQFVQIAIRSPKGQMLVVALQSPDEGTKAEDLAALRTFVDSVSFR